jgi:hypothetical protein
MSIKVFTQVELSFGKIGPISTLIEPVSENLANALFDYHLTPDILTGKSKVNFREE